MFCRCVVCKRMLSPRHQHDEDGEMNPHCIGRRKNGDKFQGDFDGRAHTPPFLNR